MSRIGKLPIAVPKGVTVTLKGTDVVVKGPKGELNLSHLGRVEVKQEGDKLVVRRFDDTRQSKAFHGLYQRLISNLISGVTNGFKKELEIQGVGYRAALQGKDLNLSLGFSHPAIYKAPKGITFSVPKPTSIVIEGSDKQVVGQVAAEIRAMRKVEPYQGKGIRYIGERVIRKAGKSGKSK
ncbi:MAG TPA: 50S ribosomal protein L6 [Candidatus Sumerlaeota bacterium]|nr:50S ribosomal protein L6 [Candidatus Sumerlaeota bacterium]